MQEKMYMRIDQAGKQSGVTEIYKLGLLWVHHLGANFHDEVALDQDFAGRHGAARFDVEQPRGVQHDGMRSSRSLRLI
jgi:hypothetical protein